MARADCDRLARGYSNLAARPELARQLARQLRTSAVAASARVLEARALVALGEHATAHELFAESDLRSVGFDNASTLHDAAVAAAHAGQFRIAVDHYRSLSAQRSLLSAPRRARVMLEAAMAVMRLGPSALPEARALLESASESSDGRADLRVNKAVRLLIDLRSGRQSADLAIEPEELSRILELESKKNAAVPHLPAADVAALMATVAERSDVEAALRLWKRYGKSSGSGPWLEWLRDHLGRLGS